MREFPLGPHGVDAFLEGRIVPDDAPPGLQEAARWIRAARAPATAGELAGQDHVVATLAAAVGGASGISRTAHEGRRPMLTKLLTAKMAAAAAAAVLGGGAAAAATGALPTSLQSSVSHGLSAVGISVPDPGSHSAGQPSSTTTSATGQHPSTPPTTAPTHAVGPSASGPALYGLCTAYAASSTSAAASHSVAFKNLAAAAKAKTQTVAQYCTGVTPPSSVPSNPSASHVPATAGANGQATANSHVPATTGPPSGTGTASAGGQATANSHVPATAGPPSGTGTASAGGHPTGRPSSGSAG